MSERDGYEPGVPCWVATVHSDPEKAVSFYTELFGWEATNLMPPESPGKYFVCRRRGRDVAAIGSERGGNDGGAPSVPAWDTYIWAESADKTVAKVTDAGGSVVVEPFDRLDAARMAVVADPAGAVFGVWQPGEHHGAQLVNEPGAWSMSQLNTRDPEGAKAFYGAVFGWETDTFDMGEGEITLWRLPGYVGGEPSQPVSREVVGVMVPMSGIDPPRTCRRTGVSTSGSTTSMRPPTRPWSKAARSRSRPSTPRSAGPPSCRTPQGAVFSVSKVGPPGA